MTDILSVNTDGSLHIVSGKYSQTLKSGVGATSGNGSKAAMEAVYKYIEENAAKIAENPKLMKALRGVVDQFGMLGLKPDNVSKLKGALNFSAANTAEETTAELIRNPLARKFLTDTKLHGMGIEDVAKLDKLITSSGKFAEYAKDVGKNKALIRGLLIDHMGEDAGIMQAVLGKNVSKVAGIAKKLGNELAETKSKLDKALLEIANLDKQIANAEANGLKTKGLDKQRAKAVKEIIKATEGKDFAGALFNAMKEKNPDLFDTLKEVNAEVEAHVEKSIKTAASTAEKSGGNKWYSIFKGPDALAETAKNEGVAVENLGFLKKIRPGKAAAVAGIAALGAYFVAGIGNKGPSERAETVARGREAEPAMGGGRA